MKKKICSKCKQEKIISKFGKNSSKKDGLQSICKKCQSKYQVMYYKKDRKKKQLVRVKNRKKELREWFKEYKGHLKCSVCSESHPACLDFHHSDINKEEGISKMVGYGFSKKEF